MRDVAEGVAGSCRLQADHRDDVAGVDRFTVLSVVCVHLEDPADALLTVPARVEHRGALHEGPGVDPQVRELADKRVAHDLERQGGERFVIARLPLDLLAGPGLDSHCGWHIERARQVVDDRVEHGLDGLVLECRPAQHRDQLARDGRLAKPPAEILRGDLLLGHVALHHVVVEVRDDVDQRVPSLLGHVGEMLGYLPGLPRFAHALAPHEGLHLQEVDHALERALCSYRKLHDRRRRLEPITDHRDRAVEIRADTVHLVHKAHARHSVLVGLAPYGLGLGLDAGDSIEDGDGSVENAKGPLDLDGEVDVAGSVDDVDPGVAPTAGRRSRRDGDPALLLLDHPVHDGATLVDLADLVGAARVVQDALGGRRLARVDMGHDPDVAGLGERELSDG